MKRTALITLALIVAAATAQAQFPGSRGMGRGRGNDRGAGREGRNAPPAPPSRADVERQDPIVVLLSNRSALALSDSQFTRLASADAGLMEKNRPLMARYDSLYALVPTGADAGTSAADVSARAGLMGVLRDVRRNYADAEHDALAVLTPDQQRKAQKLLDDQRSKQRDAFAGPRG